jgi:hypothetical protein
MAVFRITSRTWTPQAAKATVRYIKHAHRREEEPTGKPRQLFGRDGEPLSKNQAYRLIDRAGKGTTFFRIALSPDRKQEDVKKDLDLRTLTDVTMMQLQERFPNQDISYIAAVHRNTDNRHVHILAMLKAKRISKKDLTLLIRTATAEAKRQRRQLDRDTGLSPVRSPQRHETSRRQSPQLPTHALASRGWKSRSLTREPTSLPATWVPRCPNCGPGSEMERRGRRFICPNCGLRLTRGYGFGMQMQKGPGRELSLEGVGET